VIHAVITESDKKSWIHLLTGTLVVASGFAGMVVLAQLLMI